MQLHREKIMKIYVGNLAEQTTDKEIREAFASYGEVSRVAIISDKQNGHLRRWGMVKMDRAEEGEVAIAKLHGTLLGNRALKVKAARPRAERDGGAS